LPPFPIALLVEAATINEIFIVKCKM
jgi:hypothetical protein